MAGSSVDAVLVAGAPASGKSTLGRALARRLGATLLDQDVLTGPLTAVVSRLVGSDDLDSAPLAAVTRGPRYETLLAVAEDNLALARPVVLVAPFTAETRDVGAWAAAADRLGRAGGRPALVWLDLPAGEIAVRMRRRGAVRDAARLAADLPARLDPARPVVEHIAVDAGAPLDVQVEAVLRALAAPLTGHP